MGYLWEIIQKLYDSLLYVGCGNNIVLAVVLMLAVFSKKLRNYPYYRMGSMVTAAAFVVFAAGFLVHAIYQLRMIYPAMATALSMSYFHIGAVLFTLAYVLIINPRSLNWKKMMGNAAILFTGLAAYWYPIVFEEESSWWNGVYAIFLLHTAWLIFRFYRVYAEAFHKNLTGVLETMQQRWHTVPKSAYVIIFFGVLCGVFYLFSPTSLYLYVILLIAGIFAFYYIFRRIYGFGQRLLLLEENRRKVKQTENLYRRTGSKVFRYNVVYHAVIVTLATICVFMAHGYDLTNGEESADGTRFNITENTLWDSPSMNDAMSEELDKMMRRSADSTYVDITYSLDSMDVSREKCLKVMKMLDSMPESRYKGSLKLSCLNNLFFTYQDRELTPGLIHKFLERGFDVASSESIVSQGIFFTFWNNCVLTYSNIQKPDSVSKEALRLMRICRQHDRPMGLFFAYSALGYCLVDVQDYLSASDYFDKAMEYAEGVFPRYYGREWKKMRIDDSSDFISEYLFIKSMDARCHAESKDTVWLAEHEKELIETIGILSKTASVVIGANLYSALATYYDTKGYDKKYDATMARYTSLIKNSGYYNENEQNATATALLSVYYIVKSKHELRLKHGAAVLDMLKANPEVEKENMIDKAYALLLEGKYKESAEEYRRMSELNGNMLNGRNRNMLKSLSANISDESKEMQLLQAKLDSQQTRMFFISLLILVFFVMILGLGYFLYRQRQLNNELNIAIDAEARANMAKDIFLKNLNHEFRSPLNAVYGFAQLLADRSTPMDEDTARQMADCIVAGSENLTKLIDNILKVTEKLSTLDRLEDVESVLKEIEADIDER